MSVNKKTILLRAPLLCEAGYGVHARQVARWLFDLADSRDDIEVYTELLNWGQTPWITDVYKHNGLIGRIYQASSVKKELYDLTIQVQLPNEWCPELGKKNIGITAGVEADRVNPNWITNVNSMDLVIVPSQYTKTAFTNTGNLTTEIKVIGESYFDQITDESIAPLDLNLETTFNFLIFGQFTSNNAEEDRKNLGYTIKWLCEEFKNDKDVGIILKTNFGRNSELDKFNGRNVLNKLMEQVAVSENPKLYFLHGDMEEEDVIGLYKNPTVKSLVSLTRGEGFCGLDYTPIITETGVKRLDSIKVGEKVLTHKGRYMPVTQELSRDYKGDMFTIRPFGSQKNEPITLTGNHNVYTLDKTNKLSWKPVEEIKITDSVLIPKNIWNTKIVEEINIFDYIKDVENLKLSNDEIGFKHSNKLYRNIKNIIKIDNNFAKLIGYYLAEGSYNNSTIHFSLNKKEKTTLASEIIECFESVFGTTKYFISIKNNKLDLTFNSKVIGSFLKSFCGENAKTKYIDDSVLNWSSDVKMNLITSLFLGDGSFSRLKSKNKMIDIQLVNDKILRTVKLMLINENIFSSIRSFNRKGIIQNKWKYNSNIQQLRIIQLSSINKFIKHVNKNHDFINLELIDEKNISKGKPKAIFNDDYCIVNIDNIEKTHYKGKVYNLSVEEDESYCTENFVVHNCLPVLEAATSGLPVICSDYSAHIEYLKLGRYIGIETKVCPVAPGRIDNNIFVNGAQWGHPSEQDFKNKVRKFYKASEIPNQWAKDLSEKLKKNYSFEAISSQYSETLKDFII